jgi:hypothetical protein
MKGYDGTFLMKQIIKFFLLNDSKPNVILNGTKLISIEFRRIKIIDSFSFIPTALEDFSKIFSIKKITKGFFPHLFNKPENFNYIGTLPEKKFYA